MSFPIVRHRRLRQTVAMRRLVREHHLTTSDFIYPLFVVEGNHVKVEVSSMPGVYHFSLDRLQEEIEEIVSLGIPSIILFGVPSEKDSIGTQAYAENGIVQRAIAAIKGWAPELVVMADTCLCQFTDHGHCGKLEGNSIDNDASLKILAKTAVSQAQAGADVIAPSNMMDGFVHAIRAALDEAGFSQVPLLSYAVKYASSFYGPFRDAAHSAPQFGDRKTYQMDPANALEALREAEADIKEGADIIMVKPAMAFMDIIRSLRDNYDLPIAAYNVSGEYAMIKAAADKGWINEEEVVLELLTGFKRAGADLILTYFAKDAVKYLQKRGEI